MAENLVTRILKDHLVSGSLEPGEEVGLRIDQTLLQDATGTMACLQFERMGVDRVQVPFAVRYVDTDEADPLERRGDHALLRVPESGNTARDVRHRFPGEYRDAVIALLPAVNRLVAGLAQRLDGKLRVFELRFLDA